MRRWKWLASLFFQQYKIQLAVNAFCLQCFLVIHSVDPQAHFPGLGLAAAAAAKSFQSCLTLCDPIDGSPPGSPRPWDSPGKNTGVGCHFLLQCMKVKSESKVAQSCPTLSDPMDCSPPGSSAHAIFQARVLEWDAIAFSRTLTNKVQIADSLT